MQVSWRTMYKYTYIFISILYIYILYIIHYLIRTCKCACRVLSVKLTHRELVLGRMLSQTAATAALANNKFVWRRTCHGSLPPQPLFVCWVYTTLVGHLTAHPLHNPNSSCLAHQNCAHSVRILSDRHSRSLSLALWLCVCISLCSFNRALSHFH